MMSTPAFVSHSENTTPQSALIVSRNRHLSSVDVKEEDNAQPSNPETLVVVNANLEPFAVKPRLWRDAFLQEVAEMEVCFESIFEYKCEQLLFENWHCLLVSFV